MVSNSINNIFYNKLNIVKNGTYHDQIVKVMVTFNIELRKLIDFFSILA
jgi:hypothetical protein